MTCGDCDVIQLHFDEFVLQGGEFSGSWCHVPLRQDLQDKFKEKTKCDVNTKRNRKVWNHLIVWQRWGQCDTSCVKPLTITESTINKPLTLEVWLLTSVWELPSASAGHRVPGFEDVSGSRNQTEPSVPSSDPESPARHTIYNQASLVNALTKTTRH